MTALRSGDHVDLIAKNAQVTEMTRSVSGRTYLRIDGDVLGPDQPDFEIEHGIPSVETCPVGTIDRLTAELEQARARERRVRDYANGLAEWGNTALHDEVRRGLLAALDSDGHPGVMTSADEARSHELICEAVDRWDDGDLTAEEAIEAVAEQVGDR